MTDFQATQKDLCFAILEQNENLGLKPASKRATLYASQQKILLQIWTKAKHEIEKELEYTTQGCKTAKIRESEQNFRKKQVPSENPASFPFL